MTTASQRWADAWLRHPLRVMWRLRSQTTLYRQLCTLLQVGTPIPTLFADLHRATPEGPRRQALLRVASSLRRGGHLADALALAPALFDPLTIELVRAGEKTGTLEQVIRARVDQLEELRKMALQLLLALLYPVYLALMVIFLGPLLDVATTLQKCGACNALESAPGIYLHGLARNLALAGLGAGALFCLPLLIAAAGVEEGWDRLCLRLPLLAPLYRNLYAARLSAALGGALGAGLETGQSVRLALAALRSPSVSPRGEAAEGTLRQGAHLVDVVRPLGLYDEEGLNGIVVGERTGTLPAQLETLARQQWQSAARRARLVAALVFGACMLAGGAVIALKIVRSYVDTYSNLFKTLDTLERQ